MKPFSMLALALLGAASSLGLHAQQPTGRVTLPVVRYGR
jgi:hypothetical protein